MEKRASALPSCTFWASCGARLGRPCDRASDRRGGGPPGRSRASLKELHGVPSQIAEMRPARIHPRILRCTLVERRSFFRCHRTSNSKTSQRVDPQERHAADHRPDPEKISSATGPWAAAWEGRLRIGSRQYDFGTSLLARPAAERGGRRVPPVGLPFRICVVT